MIEDKRIGDRDVKFKRREKLYIADWIGKSDTYATVHDNALVYTKEELCRAKEVYELVKKTVVTHHLTKRYTYLWTGTYEDFWR